MARQRTIKDRIDAKLGLCVDFMMDNASVIMDVAMKILGPFLLLVAATIIYFLLYEFYHLVLPLLDHAKFSFWWTFHNAMVLFLITNVLYNYVLCVTCKHGGERYQRALHELARKTNYEMPETEEDVVRIERRYEEKIMREHRQREQRKEEQRRKEQNYDADTDTDDEENKNNNDNSNSDNNGNNNNNSNHNHNHNHNNNNKHNNSEAPAPAAGWSSQGRTEWSFCRRTKAPKAPRSHYDHVTKQQVREQAKRRGVATIIVAERPTRAHEERSDDLSHARSASSLLSSLVAQRTGVACFSLRSTNTVPYHRFCAWITFVLGWRTSLAISITAIS